MFGAVAAAAPVINKKIFILPTTRSVTLRVDASLLSASEIAKLWRDPLQESAYRQSALLRAQIDREVLEALSGIPDILRAADVPDNQRYAVIPTHLARQMGIDVDRAEDYAGGPPTRPSGVRHV